MKASVYPSITALQRYDDWNTLKTIHNIGRMMWFWTLPSTEAQSGSGAAQKCLIANSTWMLVLAFYLTSPHLNTLSPPSRHDTDNTATLSCEEQPPSSRFRSFLSFIAHHLRMQPSAFLRTLGPILARAQFQAKMTHQLHFTRLEVEPH